MHRIVAILIVFLTLAPCALAQTQPVGNQFKQRDKFRQLEELLPSPNRMRLASGAPGPGYWQQKVDYEIDVEIDDVQQRLIGRETIHYHNNSPHTLTYLWVALDPNLYAPNSDAAIMDGGPDFKNITPARLRQVLARQTFDGGARITAVRDANKQPLRHTIVKTMMRIDLPQSLGSGQSVRFSIDWHYRINNSKLVGGRTGCEFFEDDKNWIYEIAQWFPRMAAYTDVHGWHNRQFLGRGEFTLEFGDYLVRITVPADHVVAATGVLQNAEQVLSETQRKRLATARSAAKPMFIITPKEALDNQKGRAKTKKTWIFKARQVRDFAFASSRKFIWDAKGTTIGKNPVMAMSLYPNEAEPLWSKYSTHAIIQTLKVYSRHTVDYPYPMAISINGPVGGMEYPMICFNGPRPEKDGTYGKRTKYGLISVVIHEVGHNFFPMLINSDERQWTWMDEGFNTFVQSIAEREWEKKYPGRRGKARHIVEYMKSARQVPIMTSSESILQFGNNAYSKTSAALNILRETVMGRELFDFAFKTYCQRWLFKRPMPADFFRTMEDASGIDLDWFWRGWFYGTERCDIAIERLRHFTFHDGNPEGEKAHARAKEAKDPKSVTDQRNEKLPRRADRFPELYDFYNKQDKFKATDEEKKKYKKFLERLKPVEKKLLSLRKQFYVIDLRNIGGLVMPVIIQIEFVDGSKQLLRIPAEIWRKDNQQVSKLIVTDKKIRQLTLDPHLETADTDTRNNYFPRKQIEERFKLSKPEEKKIKNPMQRARKAAEDKKKEQKKGKEKK